MSTAKLNAVSANTKQWGIPPSASGENVIQRHIGNIDPAGMSVHHFVPVSICSHTFIPSYVVCIRIESKAIRHARE
jgi:hypothetical protein